MQPKQKRKTRFLFLGSAFALCGLASWLGLVAARSCSDRRWTLVFGYMCLFLLLAAVQSIALPLVQMFGGLPRGVGIGSMEHHLEHGEYVAKFSIQDRVIALLLVGAFVMLTTYLCIHAVPLYMRFVSVGMLAMLVWIAYRFLFTTVRFTNKRITVRMFPFGPYSESYGDIASFRAHLGNLRISFADGRRLSLWAGLGDASKIASILEDRVEILPES